MLKRSWSMGNFRTNRASPLSMLRKFPASLRPSMQSSNPITSIWTPFKMSPPVGAPERPAPACRCFSVARHLARIPLLLGANWLLYDETVEPRTQVALLGISLVAWVVLCARVGLAFRYAANPGTVDDLAVSGVTLSLGALAFLPAFILVLAFLSAVRRPEAEDLGWRRLMPALNLFVCVAIPALVWHMWPLLHLSQTPGRVTRFLSSFGAAFTAEKPCALFLLLWFAACVWLWRKARRTSRQSLDISLVNLEEALTRMWLRRWRGAMSRQ